MCTLIVLHRCVPGKPLVVAANRDEFFARPAEGLALRISKTGPILSPLDLEAGGTWVGLSQRGVFAGLTNLRPSDADADDVGGESLQSESGPNGTSVSKTRKPKELLSRGEVVMSALEAESANAAMQTLMQLEEDSYNPFQLVVADGLDGWLIVYRGSPRAIELTPGAHIVGNVEDESVASVLEAISETGEADWAEQAAGQNVPSDEKAQNRVEDKNAENKIGGEPEAAYLPGFEGIEGLVANATGTNEPRSIKLVRIRERVEKLMTDPSGDLFEELAGVCREHVGLEAGEGSPFESTCVHVADRYGTRSSLLLELATETETSRLWATDGPPCEQSFEDRSSLLGSLGVRLSG